MIAIHASSVRLQGYTVKCSVLRDYVSKMFQNARQYSFFWGSSERFRKYSLLALLHTYTYLDGRCSRAPQVSGLSILFDKLQLRYPARRVDVR